MHDADDARLSQPCTFAACSNAQKQRPERLMLMMLALQSPGLLQLAATARAADADYVLMLMMLAERLMLMMLALHSFAFLQLAATDRTADADDARPGRHYTLAAGSNIQSG